jgi:hypothetical protein
VNGSSPVPLAWIPAHPLGIGLTSVFIAISIALACVSGWLFAKGSWKTQRV